MSPSRHVSCAAASHRIPTTSDLPSRVRSAARSVMSSRSRSVAGIIGRCIADATSAAGGGRPASTRSKLPAGSGRRRTEWDRGDLGENYHMGRKAPPRPLIQGARTSAPLRPRKRNPAYRIFPDKRTKSRWMLEGSTMTMWRPNEPAEEDVRNLPGVDLQDRRRRSRRGAWRHGLADQTVVKDFEDARSYRAFERALVGSVDPRSLLELALVHRLANLLWRLRRASAIETGLFDIQAKFLLAPGQDPSRGPGQPATLQTLAQANGHKTVPGSNGQGDPPASNQDSLSPPTRRGYRGRNAVQSPNFSCVFPNLTRLCLTALAATKRDYGVRPRKPSGLLRL